MIGTPPMTSHPDIEQVVERLAARAKRHRRPLGNSLYYGDDDAQIDRQAAALLTSMAQELAEAKARHANAREAFLSLIADAARWDEDVDGDYREDSPVPDITIRYFAEFGESSVRELVEALGIPINFDETAGDAIAHVLETPPCT